MWVDRCTSDESIGDDFLSNLKSSSLDHFAKAELVASSVEVLINSK